MSDTVVVALITAAASALVSVTALLLNYRGFASIDGRFASLERRMDTMQSDLKEFYKILADHAKRISRLEDKPWDRCLPDISPNPLPAPSHLVS